MKKIGLVVFIITLAIGFIGARAMGITGSFFNISINSKVTESGVLRAEKRDLVDFDSIETSGAIDVDVVSQKDFNVAVEADENILPYIKTEVEGGTLKIYREGKFISWGSSKVTVVVFMPEINQIDISGASKATIGNLNQDSLELQCSGASKISVSGEVKNLRTDASGASKIEADALKTERAEAFASGASKILVFATEYLDADASGASKIGYVGEPKNLDKNASGASSVFKK